MLSFVNNIGGVGKTSSAQNVGVALHRFSKSRVLFVDLEAQANGKDIFMYDSESNGAIDYYKLTR